MAAMTTAIPKLQFIYFAVRARCEAPRMILEYGKIPYSDVSVAEYFGKGWGEVKKSAGEAGAPPYGQLPCMDVDGTLLAQEAAISAYCARLVPELLPSDPLELAQCESIFHAAEELSPGNPIVNVFKGEAFEAKKADFLDNVLPRRLKNFSRLMATSGGPFTMGAAPRYCDFKLYHQLSNARLIDASSLEAGGAPVATFMAAVEGLAGVKEYLAARPAAVDLGVKPMLEPNFCGSRCADAAEMGGGPDAKKAKTSP